MIKYDFLKDLTYIYRESLENLGYDKTIINSYEDKAILYIYIEIFKHRRNIKVTKRTIKTANDFTVPEEVKNGYNIFQKRVATGEDLSKHLSSFKNWLNPKNKKRLNDPLFNDWRIYHFHLGENEYKKNIWERSGPLLYAFVTDDCLYELCIGPHGKWNDVSLLEIINSNWPHLLDEFTCDIQNISMVVNTNKQVDSLRKSCLNYCITLSDGRVLLQIGGGFTATGSSSIASDYYVYMLQELKRLERTAVQILEEKIQSSDCYNCEGRQNISLSLIKRSEGIYAKSNVLKDPIPLKLNPKLLEFFQQMDNK